MFSMLSWKVSVNLQRRQLVELCRLDEADELGDDPVDFASLKYAAALLLREEAHLADSDWVVDREGRIGFDIEQPNGVSGAIVVHGNGEVVFALDADSHLPIGERRLKGKLPVDSAAPKIGEFLAGNLL